jgi:hypothetical protein
MKPRLLVFNGVDGATGRYLRPPVPLDELALRFGPRREGGRRPTAVQRPVAHADSCDLAQSGWGVIFSPEVSPAVREALRPLLEHRRRQATRSCERHYRELEHRPGETSAAFRARHGQGPGPADPEKLPYYLVLIGSPEEIPFSFQYQLDVQFGVGRLWFETPEEYAAYARNVVAVEGRRAKPPRRAVFFAPTNPGDPLTDMSADQLAAPLARSVAKRWRPASWRVSTRTGPRATKKELLRLLSGGKTPPAFLFTAGHGVGFRETDPRQRDLQGSILCSDWPGPQAETISADHFVSCRDVAPDVRLQGLISFHFACYSAGTPRWDSFSGLAGEPRSIAPRPFVAGLARRLLGQGALAVIGHVDQAWPCSFLWEGAGAQRAVFESTVELLLRGDPVGAAMEYFSDRYSEIAAELCLRLERGTGPAGEGDFDLAALWLAANDARSYVVCGDPAVRLAPSEGLSPEL